MIRSCENRSRTCWPPAPLSGGLCRRSWQRSTRSRRMGPKRLRSTKSAYTAFARSVCNSSRRIRTERPTRIRATFTPFSVPRDAPAIRRAEALGITCAPLDSFFLSNLQSVCQHVARGPGTKCPPFGHRVPQQGRFPYSDVHPRSEGAPRRTCVRSFPTVGPSQGLWPVL